MPISAKLDRAAGIWELTTGDSVSLQEIVDLTLENDWEGHRLLLWDLRAIREAPQSIEELRQAAEFVRTTREIFGDGRVAILVTSDLDFGLARLFQAFADGSGIAYEVFRDYDAARAWVAKGA